MRGSSNLVRNLLLAMLAVAVASVAQADGGSGSFASPDAALKSLIQALRDGNRASLAEVLGGAESLLDSGDDVADRAAVARFLKAYDAEHAWVVRGDSERLLEVGTDQWPFPIPLVRQGTQWHWDSEQGAEELLNRRIGRNELGAIQACLAFVDAQRDYRRMQPQGKDEYARYIVSSDGKKDGLYWEESDSGPPSPLGDAFAAARADGYAPEHGKGDPFHGYLYRVLPAQGTRAPGGAYDYRSGTRMTRGFAMVAWPARYDSSGVMTFLVSHSGVIYEKDLGPETDEIASTIVLFNPDRSWRVVSAEEEALPDS